MTAAMSQGSSSPPQLKCHRGLQRPPHLSPLSPQQIHQQQYKWFQLPSSLLASLQRPFIWSIIPSRCDPKTNLPSRGADCCALHAAPTDLASRASRRISCTESMLSLACHGPRGPHSHTPPLWATWQKVPVLPEICNGPRLSPPHKHI